MPVMLKDGVSYQVRDDLVKDHLNQGFRHLPPPQPVAVCPMPQTESTIAPQPSLVTRDRVNVNTAELKDLRTLPGVESLGMARKVRDGRGETGYKVIEDLIAAAPEIPWTSIEDKICF